MKAPVPNCITETFKSGEPITPEGCEILCSCSSLKTCIGARTHISFLLCSHKHISRKLEFCGCCTILQGKLLWGAGMIIKHLSGSMITEKSSPDVTIQLECPFVPSCHVSPQFPFLIQGGSGGRLQISLGNNTETQTHVFQVVCGSVSFLDIAPVAELLPVLTCWSLWKANSTPEERY